jgi:hypothetical protein
MTGNSRQISTRIGLTAAMLVGLVAASTVERSAAAEPTIAEMLAKCPALNSADESIETFEFGGIFPIGQVRMECSWSRADGYFLMLSDPKSGAPIIVATDDRLLQFVSHDGAVELNQDFRLKFELKSIENKLNLSFGKIVRPTVKLASVDVDFASFVSRIEPANWLRLEGLALRYNAPSVSGSTSMTVEFEPASAYPLARLELKTADSGVTLLSVDELRLNQQLRRKLRPFPKDEEFPRDLVLARVADPAPDEFRSQMALSMKIATRIATSAAIDDPSQRERAEKLEKIDWEAAKANRAKFGPALNKLFARAQP